MLFIKAAKVLSMSMILFPITGACIGVGQIFGSLIRGCAYAPRQEETMFNYAILGFAMIETFVFMLFGTLFVLVGM